MARLLRGGRLLNYLSLRLRHPPRRGISDARTAAPSVDGRCCPGLFSLPGLHVPSDFPRLAQEALTSCDDVRARLPSLTGTDVLYELDAISNSVCGVIDAAELCRSVHSSAEFREAADVAFATLSGYIQALNTDVDLYQSLRDAPGQMAPGERTEERDRMARLLRAEFERDGIHLPDCERAAVSAAQNRVTELETAFSSNIITRGRKHFVLPAADIGKIIPPHVLAEFGPEPGSPDHDRLVRDGPGEGAAVVSSDSQVVNTILKYCDSPSSRKEAWYHHNTSCPENIDVLEELIRCRHEAATLLGFESYSQRVLDDKMANSPGMVGDFLQNMSRASQKSARTEMAQMLNLKRRVEGATADAVEPWDVPFYSGIIKSHTCDFESAELRPYLSTESVLEGVGELCRRLFGISLEEVPMEPGERWCDERHGVRKLELSHETEGLVGTIYLDLYPRPEKYVHSAHFSVQLGLTSRDGGTLRQLPIVALVCNFSSPPENGVSLLGHSEVEIFLHEFGHALHSLLSRTSFQHLSGTRAPIDFVEIPSHLFEYFANDVRSLNLFARHHSTGEPVPEELVKKLHRSKAMFQGTEVQTQVLYSKFDQNLFGVPTGASPSEIFSSLHHDMGIPHMEGTFWYSRFGHLVSYGAGYYGYLYDQVIAADIWETVFRKDPLGRASGEALRRELLVHGGARNPHKMLKNFLGRAPKVEPYFDALGILPGSK